MNRTRARPRPAPACNALPLIAVPAAHSRAYAGQRQSAGRTPVLFTGEDAEWRSTSAAFLRYGVFSHTCSWNSSVSKISDDQIILCVCVMANRGKCMKFLRPYRPSSTICSCVQAVLFCTSLAVCFQLTELLWIFLQEHGLPDGNLTEDVSENNPTELDAIPSTSIGKY